MKSLSLTAFAVLLTGSMVFSNTVSANPTSMQNLSAKPSAAGSVAGSFSMGSITFPVIAASAVAVGVAAAVASNSGGRALPQPIRLTPKCNGSDPLVNNICVGSRTESRVVVTGTGTSTSTTTVPVNVTFTYAPTLG